MDHFLDQGYFNNTVQQYLWFLTGTLIAWLLLRIIKGAIIGRFKKGTDYTSSLFDNLVIETIEKYIIPFVYIFANYLLLMQLNLSIKVDRILTVILSFMSTYFIVRVVIHVLHQSVFLIMHKKGESENRIRQLTGMLLVFKAVLWIVGILMLVDNLGYDVTTILTGLGIGGIAIALAAQNIFGDLFSYFVIFFDKPFEIGDFYS